MSLTREKLERAIAYSPPAERPFLIVPKRLIEVARAMFEPAGVDVYEAPAQIPFTRRSSHG